MDMPETDETRGLSQRELLLEVRDDVKDIRKEHSHHRDDCDREMSKRPTRVEITTTATALAIFIGLIFTAVAL